MSFLSRYTLLLLCAFVISSCASNELGSNDYESSLDTSAVLVEDAVQKKDDVVASVASGKSQEGALPPASKKQEEKNTQITSGQKSIVSAHAGKQASSRAVPSAPKMPGVSISRVAVPERVVALTFDDGPHPSLTPRLLDILKAEGAKATFFVLGTNARRYPDIIRRAVEEGHEVANHSTSHPVLSKSGASKIAYELETCAQAVKDACGVAPKVMRPPYGAMTTAQRQAAYNKYGYHIIFWDVDPLDWKKPGPSVVANRLIQGAKPGSVLLSHDIHAGTIEAMPAAIRGLKANGYRLVTVSELIEMGKNYAQSVNSAVAKHS